MTIQNILKNKEIKVQTVNPKQSLSEAIVKLQTENIGAVIVSSNGKVIEGILSERDVVGALGQYGKNALDMNVDEFMTRDVITCQPSEKINNLISLMSDQRFRHLPVVNSAGELISIISMGDIVSERLKEVETDASQLFQYIRSS